MKRKKLILFNLLFIFLVLSLLLISAEQLKVTNEHPFYLNGEWVGAEDLVVGDEFKTIDGKTARIINIIDVESNFPFLVYNLEDFFFHNYVVDLGLIVHNSKFDDVSEQLSDIKFYPSEFTPDKSFKLDYRGVSNIGPEYSHSYLRVSPDDARFVGKIVSEDLSSGEYFDEIASTKLLPEVYGENTFGFKAVVKKDPESGELKVLFWDGKSGIEEPHHTDVVVAMLSEEGAVPFAAKNPIILGSGDQMHQLKMTQIFDEILLEKRMVRGAERHVGSDVIGLEFQYYPDKNLIEFDMSSYITELQLSPTGNKMLKDMKPEFPEEAIKAIQARLPKDIETKFIGQKYQKLIKRKQLLD